MRSAHGLRKNLWARCGVPSFYSASLQLQRSTRREALLYPPCVPMKSSHNNRYIATPTAIAPKKLTRAEVSQIKSDHYWEVVRPADIA